MSSSWLGLTIAVTYITLLASFDFSLALFVLIKFQFEALKVLSIGAPK